jgi:thymidylate kinase
MVAYILFNGPKHSGKTTVMNLVMKKLEPMAAKSGKVLRSVVVSDELKRRTHEHYGMKDLMPGHFESLKEQPLPEFRGLSPRAAYIAMFEDVVKPRLGDAGLGTLLADRLIDSSTDVALINGACSARPSPSWRSWAPRTLCSSGCTVRAQASAVPTTGLISTFPASRPSISGTRPS